MVKWLVTFPSGEYAEYETQLSFDKAKLFLSQAVKDGPEALLLLNEVDLINVRNVATIHISEIEEKITDGSPT